MTMTWPQNHILLLQNHVLPLTLKNALLEDEVARMSDEVLERLSNPPSIPLELNNPGIRHSISIYLACEGAPSVNDVLSFHNVEKLISTYTGIESMLHNMCSKSCLAFMGPYSALDNCPIYGTSHWNQVQLQASNEHTRVTAQKFTTILLGLKLQALDCHLDSAHNMCYLYQWTQ